MKGISNICSLSGEEEICPKCSTYHSMKTHWEIRSTSVNYHSGGICVEEESVTKAKYVVLATGSHDDPRKLMVGPMNLILIARFLIDWYNWVRLCENVT